MKKCGFLAVFAIALLTLIPAAMAQTSTCTAVTPANTAFNASLLGSGFSGTSGSPNGFATVNFGINGTTATVNASSLGLNNITGIQLFQGQPGASGAQLVQTFNGPFTNGQFTGSTTLSPLTISQIQSNPGNFFFVVTSSDFPNGALAGSLAPQRQQLVTGVLAAPLINNAGNFLLSVGPNNGTGNVTLNFDISAASLSNSPINSIALMPAAGGSPIVSFGNLGVPINGRLTGSTQISSALAQQILSSPCSFSLSVNSNGFSSGSAIGTLQAGNEVFLPVVGSALGVGGTNFQTDVSVFNNVQFFGNAPQSLAANAFVQFFPAGTLNSTTSASAQNVSTLTIPVRGTTTMRDISTSMFNGAIHGIGALRITTGSPGSTLFANARIYNNQIAGGHGTFGQFEPGMTRDQALQSGVLVGLGVVGTDPSVANGQSFRTNIGFFNPNDTPTTVSLEMRGPSGQIFATQTITLAPWTQTQLPLTNAGGLFSTLTNDIPTASVYFLSGNPIFMYASQIDNTSGDASFITPSAAFTSGTVPGQ